MSPIKCVDFCKHWNTNCVILTEKHQLFLRIETKTILESYATLRIKTSLPTLHFPWPLPVPLGIILTMPLLPISTHETSGKFKVKERDGHLLAVFCIWLRCRVCRCRQWTHTLMVCRVIVHIDTAPSITATDRCTTTHTLTATAVATHQQSTT